MKVLGLFPGQGSQSVGMAKDLFDNYSEAKKMFAVADDVLNFKLSKLCFEGPIEELTLTQNAQPALLTVSYIAYILSEVPIVVTAGHSLGEYTAMVAAGVLKFEDAVKLVNKRGNYMQEAVPLNTGAMIAVMGMEEAPLREKINEHLELLVEIANINSPGQIVLAGKKIDIAKFSEILSAAGAKTIPLNVSAPFHCSLMKPAADKLSIDLDKTDFQDPKINVYSNYTTKLISSGSEARQCLKDQVCGTVNWTKEIQTIIANEGISTAIEFGPNGVLSKLMKRIDAKIARHEIHDCKSLEKVSLEILGDQTRTLL